MGAARRGDPHGPAQRHHPALRRHVVRLVARAAWEAELAFAHGLADLADAISLPAFRAGAVAEDKADGSPVTAADRAVERALRQAINTRYPGHAVLGEEDGLAGPEGAPTWVIDPIDGTKNFVRGIPVFATLVALAVDEVAVVGVASAPALGSRWDATRGGVARRDGDQIHVTTTASLGDADVSLGSQRRFAALGLEGFLPALVSATSRQRGYGDFWHHCLVASGGVDMAIDPEVNRWDLAAVKVIVEAAGGRLSSLTGEDTDAGGSALTTNGLLHDAVLRLLQSSTPREHTP